MAVVTVTLTLRGGEGGAVGGVNCFISKLLVLLHLLLLVLLLLLLLFLLLLLLLWFPSLACDGLGVWKFLVTLG